MKTEESDGYVSWTYSWTLSPMKPVMKMSSVGLRGWILSRRWPSMGLPATGTKTLVMVFVNGLNRFPMPAAGMMTFMLTLKVPGFISVYLLLGCVLDRGGQDGRGVSFEGVQ